MHDLEKKNRFVARLEPGTDHRKDVSLAIKKRMDNLFPDAKKSSETNWLEGLSQSLIVLVLTYFIYKLVSSGRLRNFPTWFAHFLTLVRAGNPKLNTGRTNFTDEKGKVVAATYGLLNQTKANWDRNIDEARSSGLSEIVENDPITASFAEYLNVPVQDFGMPYEMWGNNLTSSILSIVPIISHMVSIQGVIESDFHYGPNKDAGGKTMWFPVSKVQARYPTWIKLASNPTLENYNQGRQLLITILHLEGLGAFRRSNPTVVFSRPQRLRSDPKLYDEIYNGLGGIFPDMASLAASLLGLMSVFKPGVTLGDPVAQGTWMIPGSIYRRDLQDYVVDGERKYHKGLDLALNLGTKLIVPKGIRGQVVVLHAHKTNNPNKEGWGNYLELLMPDGTMVRLAHMLRFNAKLNSMINKPRGRVSEVLKPGQLLGYTGQSGSPGSAHLHMEVIKKRRPKASPSWSDPKLNGFQVNPLLKSENPYNPLTFWEG